MQSTWPTIFQGSLDYLPIQASAVPSERMFSSSAETDTKKRNRINPVLMESLQMLKFALKKARLDFTRGWITPEHMMQERAMDKDLLAALFEDGSEDVMDQIIRDFAADDMDDTETPIIS
jgi:hAT family C-terminal dimerisation region